MILTTGAEMLIQTRASLNKVEGFRDESFEPEEIMMYINKSQIRLIDNLVNKNFEQGTLKYEWIRSFLSTNTPALPAWVDDTLTITLPADQHYLISAKANAVVSGITGGSFEDGCNNVITDPNAAVTNPLKKLVQIKITETGQAIDKTHNSFYGTNNLKEPVAEVQSNTLIIYRGKSYILEDVVLDYVATPAEIVNDNNNIVWSSAAAEVIVDYTVEYMRLTVGDPSYQGNVNDMNIRTQNSIL
jgi:hypothetical protein